MLGTDTLPAGYVAPRDEPSRSTVDGRARVHSPGLGNAVTEVSGAFGSTAGDAAFGINKVDRRGMLGKVAARLFGEVADERNCIGRFEILTKLGAGGMGVVYKAHDPELDRPVAIKLLHPRFEESALALATQRMRREARAMARLSHANVAHIHEVGDHDGQLFLAMEFVDGVTLADWLADERRGWREIVEVFCQAGAGLSAAHEAGIVHRDFKPDNVMIGAGGVVKVMDFGLAGAARECDPALSGVYTETISDLRESNPLLAQTITRTGAMLGTPLYMSPEQFAGVELDARSDQFSFCVALYEALLEERPFADQTMHELVDSVTRGLRRPLPRGHAVPGWILRAVERGLERDPSRRWSSMRALTRRLSHDPRRRWRTVAVMSGAAVVLAGSGYAAAALGGEATERCADAGRGLEGAWDDARREQVKRALLGTGLVFADDAWTRSAARLEQYAARWTEMRVEACETHEAGLQSDELFDLRASCLERRRQDLEATVHVLSEADASVAARAVETVAALPAIRRCADVGALRTQLAPPDDEEDAAAVRQLDGVLARAAARKHAGQLREALELVDGARGRAETIGYAPLIGRVRLLRGDLLSESGKPKGAARELYEAIWIAVELGDTELATEAVAKWMFVEGAALAHKDEALSLERMAFALAARLGSGSAAVPLVYNNVGAVYYRHGRLGEAQGNFQRALELWERTWEPNRIVMAASLSNLGVTLNDLGRHEQAATYLERAYTTIAEEVGEHHPSLLYPLTGLGQAQLALGDLPAARARFDRARALIEEALGEEAHQLVYPLTGLGQVYNRQGRGDRALEVLTRANAIWATAGADNPDRGDTLCALGAAQRALGRVDEARAAYGEAAKIYEAVLEAGDDPGPRLATPLVALGELAREADKPGEAVSLLKRALAWQLRQRASADEQARTRFTLARALVESVARVDEDALALRREEIAEALALADEALAAYATGAPERAELERWIDAVERGRGSSSRAQP